MSVVDKNQPALTACSCLEAALVFAGATFALVELRSRKSKWSTSERASIAHRLAGSDRPRAPFLVSKRHYGLRFCEREVIGRDAV